MAKSDNTQQMLRTIINGQSSFRQDVLSKIDQLDNKLTGRIDSVEKNLTKRIDKIGKQIAYLEDDTPTSPLFASAQGAHHFSIHLENEYL